MQLRDYQKEAAKAMSEKEYLLLALKMGFGKTAVTLTAINDLLFDSFSISRVLIVAPLRVAEMVWDAEAQKWPDLKHLTFTKILGSKTYRKSLLEPINKSEIFVINRENLSWLVDEVAASGQKWPYDCVVIDENRGFKDRASRAWKALKSVRKSIKHLYLLTGTPAPNSLLELWPQVSLLDGGQRLETGITKYKERYFDPDRRNGHIVYSWRLKPGAEEAIQRKVSDIIYTASQGVSLPPRVDNIVQIKLADSVYKKLKDFARDKCTDTITAANAAVLAGKLAQMANGAVYDDEKNVEEIHTAKLEALEEILDQGDKVLCFVSFKHDIKRIQAKFKDSVLFDGEKSIKAWKDKKQLLIMHPASGGHGVDGLQHIASTAVWFGVPFSLDLYEQANARLHRSGQKNPVAVHHLIAARTVDEDILKVLETKGDVQAALLTSIKKFAEKK